MAADHLPLRGRDLHGRSRPGRGARAGAAQGPAPRHPGLVGTRSAGGRSGGLSEAPGGRLLLEAQRGIESITLAGGAAHLQDERMPRCAGLIYTGFWFAPEGEMLQAAIDASRAMVWG